MSESLLGPCGQPAVQEELGKCSLNVHIRKVMTKRRMLIVPHFIQPVDALYNIQYLLYLLSLSHL